MAAIAELTDATFDEELSQADVPVLVDFWAEWCAPCKAMAPVLDQISAEQTHRLRVVKVDTDENVEYAGRLGILSIPTLVLFKDGEPVERIVGYQTKQQVMAKLTPHL